MMVASGTQADPAGGLEARISLARPPTARSEILFFDLSLRNVSPGAIRLGGWDPLTWDIQISSTPDDSLGCAELVAEKPTRQIELAPNAEHHWRVTCRAAVHPSRVPVRLRGARLKVRAVYLGARQPSWLLPEDPRRVWSGSVASDPIAFDVPAAPGELEPPREHIVSHASLGACALSITGLTFYRYFIPPVHHDGMRDPPPTAEPQGRPVKQPTGDLIMLGLKVENAGRTRCRLRDFWIRAYDKAGTAMTIGSLLGAGNAGRGWRLDVPRGAIVETAVGPQVAYSNLVPGTSYVLIMSVDDADGNRAWLKAGPAVFEPPEAHPTAPDIRHPNPRIP